MVQSKYKDVLKNLPRLNLKNLEPNPYHQKEKRIRLGKKNRREGIRPKIKPRIGFEIHTPFQKLIPKYGYNRESHLKRQYLPFSLWKLQELIDLGRLDPEKPIDITAIANSRGLNLDKTDSTCYGLFLVDQGANIFNTKVNIEVQIASELATATIEKSGGVITTAFYDRLSFLDLCDPVKAFSTGKPLRKRLLPPEDLVTYYTDPKVRGYLSDPEKVQEERIKLAAKYGYTLPDVSKDKHFEMLSLRKDPRQIFFGLAPGWIVNLPDKTVIQPQNSYLRDYSEM